MALSLHWNLVPSLLFLANSPLSGALHLHPERLDSTPPQALAGESMFQENQRFFAWMHYQDW
jgi:hypothetical protein